MGMPRGGRRVVCFSRPVRTLIPLLLSLAACGKADVKAVEDERLPNEVCLELAPEEQLAPRSCLALSSAAPADLLFVIDDGPGSLPLQRRLADAMPAFVDRVLQSPLPYDLRIAFEAPDPEPSLRRPKPCDVHAEDFTDLAACEAACDGSELALDAPRWVEIVAGEPIDRDQLVETLRCGAMLGDTGPNVAEPLRSTVNAWFSGDPFFRPAIQSAVIVTGGPECSRNRPQSIAAREVADPDEAREQCYAAGTLCDDLGCRAAHLDHLGEETTADDARLLPVTLFADKVEALAHRVSLYIDPVQVLAIAPPAEGDTEAVCDLDGSPLYPAIRLAALDEQSELDVVSACEADWAPYLQEVGERLADSFPMCMPACIADVDEDAPGLQVDCEVVMEQTTAEGTVEREVLPRCDEGDGAFGCWRPATGDRRHPICAEEGFNLEIRVELSAQPAINQAFFPSCELSQTKSKECPDLR